MKEKEKKHEKTQQTVLYIDGQNFTTRIRSILRRRGFAEVDLAKFDFWGLLSKVFEKEDVDLVQIYFAKLHAHKDTAEKSEELIKREEELKVVLEKQGIKYITAGSVRPRKRGDEIEFVEKGVDIRMAVDMVTDVIDGTVKRVFLLSSDSDMQPAVYEMKQRSADVWYVGFKARMNRGLMLTTDRYVLIDNADVERFYSGLKGEVLQPVPNLSEEQPVRLKNEQRTVIDTKSHAFQPPKKEPVKAPTIVEASDVSKEEQTEFNMPPWTRKKII